MCSTNTCCKVNVNCSWFLNVDEYWWLFHVPSAPCCAPARGQEAGPQCPDVPLPAPEAADALPGEVSHPPSPDTLVFLLYISPLSSSLTALSASSSLCYPLSNIWLGVSLFVTSADTGMSQRFLTQEHQQMRRMRMEISPCMSVLGWHLWVNSVLVSELFKSFGQGPLCSFFASLMVHDLAFKMQKVRQSFSPASRQPCANNLTYHALF